MPELSYWDIPKNRIDCKHTVEVESSTPTKEDKEIDEVISFLEQNTNKQYGGYGVGIGSTIYVENGKLVLGTHQWSYFGGCNPKPYHKEQISPDTALRLAKKYLAKEYGEQR